MEIMMALGEFQFSIQTMQYQSLKKSRSWRWAKLERVGRKPAKQFKGANDETRSFDISHFPQDAKDVVMFDQIAKNG